MEFNNEELPHHVKSFLDTQSRERVDAILRRAEMDDSEMNEIEPWQVFDSYYNFLR